MYPRGLHAPAAFADALANHYQLERELGVGGMATVYRAQDRKHGREVAIKVLRPDPTANILIMLVLDDESGEMRLAGPQRALEVELATHCRERTWSCKMDLVGR
jgi:serine/threonine protein kinase